MARYFKLQASDENLQQARNNLGATFDRLDSLHSVMNEAMGKEKGE